MKCVSREKSNMRFSNVAALVLVVGATSCLAVASARAASDCSVSTTLADWGQASTSHIDIASGDTCQFPIRFPGTISSTDISKKPDRGKLKKVNLSTFQYAAKARFKGSDSFAITATGKDQKGSGTSVISVQVTVK